MLATVVSLLTASFGPNKLSDVPTFHHAARAYICKSNFTGATDVACVFILFHRDSDFAPLKCQGLLAELIQEATSELTPAPIQRAEDALWPPQTKPGQPLKLLRCRTQRCLRSQGRTTLQRLHKRGDLTSIPPHPIENQNQNHR